MEGVVGIGANRRVVKQSCEVRFVCPKCRGEDVADAYDGPAYHVPCRAWMIPVSLIVEDAARAFIRPAGMPESALPNPNRPPRAPVDVVPAEELLT